MKDIQIIEESENDKSEPLITKENLESIISKSRDMDTLSVRTKDISREKAEKKSKRSAHQEVAEVLFRVLLSQFIDPESTSFSSLAADELTNLNIDCVMKYARRVKNL